MKRDRTAPCSSPSRYIKIPLFSPGCGLVPPWWVELVVWRFQKELYQVQIPNPPTHQFGVPMFCLAWVVSTSHIICLMQQHRNSLGCVGSSKGPLHLDCYWVGSLDFNFWEINGFSTKPATVELFAEGSRATKTWDVLRGLHGRPQSRLLSVMSGACIRWS